MSSLMLIDRKQTHGNSSSNKGCNPPPWRNSITPAPREQEVGAQLHVVIEVAGLVLVDPPDRHALAPRHHRRLLRRRPLEVEPAATRAAHRIRPYELLQVVVAAHARPPRLHAEAPRKRRGHRVPERAALWHPAGAAVHSAHVEVAGAAQHAYRRLHAPAEPARPAASPVHADPKASKQQDEE
ncbi:unnamed protein product [Musa banksii]